MNRRQRPAHFDSFSRRRRRLRPEGIIPLEDRRLLASFLVTNTLDSGPGTLRQAILDANANAGPDNIDFQIPASIAPALDVPVPGFDPVSQTWKITLNSALPPITDTVKIDGYSQAHFPVPFRYQSIRNDIQQVALSGNPTGGTFTLDFNYTVGGGGLLSATTAPIPWNATAAQVQTALVALDPQLVGGVKLTGNIQVTGGALPGNPINVEFINQLGGQSIPLMFSNSLNLTGGSFPHVVTWDTQTGSSVEAPPVAIESTVNTTDALQGNNAIIRVIIDGHLAGGATGFSIQAAHSILRGLDIDGFGIGVEVPVPAAPNPRNTYDGVLIQGNSIGGYYLYFVDPKDGTPLSGAGSQAFVHYGNSLQGIVLGSTNAIVGGTTPQDANVIVNSGSQGISILAGAEGNVVHGNQIGIVGPNSSGRYVVAPNGADGVLIASSSNTVGGSTGGSGNLISANLGAGVRIVGVGATQNRVEGNFIGTGPGGGYLFGAGDPGNLGDGVRIENAPDNRVGGPLPAQGNVIAANEGAGVRITGSAAINTTLQSNIIGLTAGGASALGNSQAGIWIDTANATIGPANVISSNLRGIELVGPGASNTTIVDNFIGTDSKGNYDLGNAKEGIRIDNAPNNTVSASAPGAQLISGNDQGIVIVGAGATGNVVKGVFIGADVTGSIAIANSQQGVLIDGAANNTIGGNGAGLGNLVFGNHWGVELRNAGATGNRIQGNTITRSEREGVLVQQNASNNTIGGAASAAANTISFNSTDGIHVVSGNGIVILSNSITDNGGLGIRLDPGANHDTAAPTIALASAFTNWTVFSGSLFVSPSLAGRTIGVQFFSNPTADPSGFGEGKTLLGATNLKLPDAASFPSDSKVAFDVKLTVVVPEGQIVAATATLLDALLQPVETSAFSKSRAVDSFSTTVTTTADSGPGSLRSAIDHANANAGLDIVNFAIPSEDPGFDPTTLTWRFNIASALPAITSETVIDGYTQRATALINGFLVQVTSVPNDSITGDNAKLRLILDGGLSVTTGLEVQQTSTIRGLIFDRFVSAGIHVEKVDKDHNGTNSVIQGNFFGVHVLYQLDPVLNLSTPVVRGSGNSGSGVLVDAGARNVAIGGTDPSARNVLVGNGGTGVTFNVGADQGVVRGNIFGLAVATMDVLKVLGNGDAGVKVLSANNTIGGPSAAARNVMADNGRGVWIVGPSATGNLVQGNYLGTGLAGTAGFGALATTGNRIAGVDVENAAGNTIGGATTGAGNLIANTRLSGANTSAGSGVRIIGAAATGNAVIGNAIGLDVNGNPVGNAHGVVIDQGASSNRIGGFAAGEGNIIAFNGSDAAPDCGVWILSGLDNAILSNSIYQNGGEGILLDPGANRDQPAPTLDSVGSDGIRTVIAGTLSTPAAPNTFYTLQFFANPLGVTSTQAEGQTLIGSTTVRTDASGQATVSATLLVGLSLNQYVTAIATTLDSQAVPRNSSAFSIPTIVGTIQSAGTILVTTTSDSGPGSLRQAILDANARGPSPMRIAFFIVGNGLQTILPQTPLPTITNTVYLDGYSQRAVDASGRPNTLPFTLNDSNAAPDMVLLIELRGILLPRNQPGQDGLIFDPPNDGVHTTSNSVVAGLMIADFPGSGIVLADQSASASGSAGVSILGNILQNNGVGVTIRSSNNKVGDPLATSLATPADRNLIQGNHTGILIEPGAGDAATGNRIQDNFIYGNQNSELHDGAGIIVRSSNNTIGGGLPASGNAILFNDRGIVIEDTHPATANGQANAIQANRIGDLDANGYPTRGNLREGILISNAPGTFVSRNVIIANGSDASAPDWSRAGVRVTADAAPPSGSDPFGNLTPTVLQGNLIGADISRTQLFSGNFQGVWIEANHVLIGGATASAGNVISANQRNGVVLSGRITRDLTDVTLQANLIGLDATGTLPFGNTLSGVLIDGADGARLAGNTIGGNNTGILLRDASNNMIGGDAATAGNTIKGNSGIGVNVLSGVANAIRSNTIFGNGALGIDLGGDGPTPNGPQPRVGPNNLVNSPALFVFDNGTQATIQGTYQGLPDTNYAIQLFSNDGAGLGSQVPLGTLTIKTDAGGNAAINQTISGGLDAGQFVTATATDPQGNTSEFSATAPVVGSIARFAASSLTVPETAGSVPIQVNRIGTSAAGSVAYSINGGTPVTLSFSAGQASRVFNLPIPHDNAPNGDQSIVLTLGNPVNLAVGSPSQMTVTVKDADAPGQVAFTNSTLDISEKAGVVLIPIQRTGGSGGDVVVQYQFIDGTARDGVDYTGTTGTLTFTSNGPTTLSIPVSITNNTQLDGDRAFTVALSLMSGPTGAAVVAPSTLTVTIHDDDLALQPPVVSRISPVLGTTAITGINVIYSKPMDAQRATTLFNYDTAIVAAGRDGVFDTADDVRTKILTATYHASSRSVRLIPVTPLAYNGFYRLSIDRVITPVVGPGVSDTYGNVLDGDGDGRAGGAYIAYIGVGSRLSYRDTDGDQVALSISGGGMMQMVLGSDRAAESLKVLGARPGKTVITGSVKPIGRSKGRTGIARLEGTSGVSLRLPSPAFLLGGGVQAAVATKKAVVPTVLPFRSTWWWR